VEHDPEHSYPVFERPRGVLAGFHAGMPDPAVPELVHIGEQWVPASFQIGAHAHQQWEFYLQLDGVSCWESQGEKHRLRPGDLFLAVPGGRHALVDQPARHHFFFAAIDVTRVLRRHPELRDAWGFRRCRMVSGAEVLTAPFRQLVDEVAVRSPHRSAGMRAALDYLVIAATRLLEAGERRAQVALHAAVARVKEALDRHPEQPWTLAEMARLAGLAPSHLAALFAREVGTPPRRYLLGRRIERAQQLLRSSDLPITALALELGFSSSQHFAKTFRLWAKTSARAYRRKHGRE
jgi:AraC-like DNA-binding protein